MKTSKKALSLMLSLSLTSAALAGINATIINAADEDDNSAKPVNSFICELEDGDYNVNAAPIGHGGKSLIFADYENYANVEFTAPANGDYKVTAYFFSPFGARTAKVALDDFDYVSSVIASGMNPTGITAFTGKLEAGKTYTVKTAPTSKNFYADYVEVEYTEDEVEEEYVPYSATIEAETGYSAENSSNISVETNYKKFSEFTGDGYVRIDRKGIVSYNINVPVDATYEFTIKNTAGSLNKNVKMEIANETTKVCSESFNTNRGYSWTDHTFKTKLAAGDYVLTLSCPSRISYNALIDSIAINEVEDTGLFSQTIQAEDAYVAENSSKVKVETNYNNFKDYTGNGYLRIERKGYVEYNVTIPEDGNYKFDVVNTAGSAFKNVKFEVFDTNTRLYSEYFFTGRSYNWADHEVTLALAAGEHTLRFSCQNFNSYNALIDCIKIDQVEEETVDSESTSIQAEQSYTDSKNAEIEKDYKGFDDYSGEGYVRIGRDGHVNYDVNIAEDGTYTFVIRNTAGSAEKDAKAVLTTDSETAFTEDFLTGSGYSWTDKTITVTLKAGKYSLNISCPNHNSYNALIDRVDVEKAN